MNYQGKTRYKGESGDNFSRYKKTAAQYPHLLSEEEQLGFRQKPFDWSKGHPNFLNNMYQILGGIEAMQLDPGAKIIEVGSGTGWVTEILACLKYNVTCIEPAGMMVDVAKERVSSFLKSHAMPNFNDNISYQITTLEEADIDDDSVDAVLFFESFHHIIDEHIVLEKVGRILKSDGIICILGDANWIPGHQEQEAFWEDEMARFDTLESPFTHDYLTSLLKHHDFGSIQRHHGVNGLIPIERDSEPVVNFSGHLNAEYVNLITARNMPDQNNSVENDKQETVVDKNDEQETIVDENYIPPKPSKLRSFVASIYHKSPKFMQPVLSWAWNKINYSIH